MKQHLIKGYKSIYYLFFQSMRILVKLIAGDYNSNIMLAVYFTNNA